jgi:hypothetical protein
MNSIFIIYFLFIKICEIQYYINYALVSIALLNTMDGIVGNQLHL